MSRTICFVFPLVVQFLLVLNSRSVYAAAAKDDQTTPPCMRQMEEMKKAILGCKAQLNLTNIPDLDSPKEVWEKYQDDVEKAGFDDKCMMKCLADKFKVATPEGCIDMEEMTEYYEKGNLTESVRKEVLKAWEMCSLESEKAMPGGGDKSKLCKKLAMIDVCYARKTKNLDFAMKCTNN